MLKNLSIVAVLFTSLVACKSKSAFNYSQAIVAKDKSITPEIKSSREKIEKFATNSQYDSVVACSERTEKFVQQNIDEIDAMAVPKVKEADNFKAAILRYFKYIKSIFTGYKAFGNAQSDEARQKEATSLQAVLDGSRNVLDEMQSAQKKYADANGFKVQ